MVLLRFSFQTLTYVNQRLLFNKHYMKLLELDDSSTERQGPDVISLLHQALESQGIHLNHSALTLAPHQKITYQTNLYLPRAQTFINVIWQPKVRERLVLMDLRLNSLPTSSSSIICRFFKQNGAQINQFVYLTNNLSINDAEGYFVFNEDTGEISLRYKITKFRYLSSCMNILRYFNRCIAKVHKIFASEIETLIFYYKLPGFSLLEVERQTQGQNHVPLMQEAENIVLLQKYFQQERYERKNGSKQAVKASTQVQVKPCMNFLLASSYEEKSQPFNKLQADQKMSIIQNMFKFQIESLCLDIQHKRKQSQPILTSIKITEIAKESLLGTGGYSEIIFGVYRFIPQISIFHINPTLETSNSNDDESFIKNGSLVKKVCLKNDKGEANISLENQCNFLKYIRNKICPYLARYYCKSQTQYPFSDGQIYLQFYPNNLGQTRLREDRKMKVIEDVCSALLFMNQEKILHRDLKEVNIMVDRYHRGRLIDFGSVANIKGSSRFKPKDQKVRSTQGYFASFREAVRQIPRFAQKMTKEQFYSHETFDLYGLGKILENEFYLDNFIGNNHFVRYNMKLLSQKCKELNPQDRWTIQQVIVFIRHLMIFSQLRKQFWKRGFDPRFRAHQLGKFYNGNGGYEPRQQEVRFQGQHSFTFSK